MRIHRVTTQEKLFGNLDVGLALGDVGQNFYFSLGEQNGVACIIGQFEIADINVFSLDGPENLAAKECASAARFFNRFEHFVH